jgi:dihydrolipoamide dehydrogenase
VNEFDLIVIGSGAGLDVASGVAEQGLKVAIVERGPLGGTCLNRGCIPSKLLIHSADVVETIKRAPLFGIKVNGFSVDFQAIINRVSDYVDTDARAIEEGLGSTDNPRLFKEDCKFIGHKTLKVGKETLKAEKILIASGGRPSIPKIDGLEESGFITSDEALRLKTQPKVMTILGGGYIAAELAHFYGSLGTQINIVERNETLLHDEDEDIARSFTSVFKSKHNVLTGFEPVKVSRNNGDFKVTLKSVKSGETRALKSDHLLVAAGRTPNSEGLALEKTGVKIDQKGFIITDQYLETNVEGIFALGDAIGHYLFRHSANLEAQYDFNNILSDERIPVDYTAMPHAVFSSPQVAGVGKTEQKLRAENADYIVGKYNYIDTAMGKALEDDTGFVKFLFDKKTRQILGCHIMGSDASTLIHEAIVAMRAGGGAPNITKAVHVHPALSEVVQRAAANVHSH